MVFYCNKVEITHSTEVFCLMFQFLSPDGEAEKVTVNVGPRGAKTLIALLQRDMERYEEEHGELDPWKIDNPDDCPDEDNNPFLA